MLEDPISHIGDHSTRKHERLLRSLKRSLTKEDLVIFSNAVYKAKGNVSFGFIMVFNIIIVDAGTVQGPKVSSLKEVEAREVLVVLVKAGRKCFDKARILTDAKEVVQALKVDSNWCINSIIPYI